MYIYEICLLINDKIIFKRVYKEFLYKECLLF